MPHRWSDSAELRRTQIESGKDITFAQVFKPIFINQITQLAPKRVLEVGAGTGHLSRALSEYNIDITALEPSPGMHGVAIEVLSGSKVNLLNNSSFDFSLPDKFDLAFSHLVAHVVESLDEFILSVSKNIVNNGYFLFSIPHPCFYNDYKKFLGEDYNYMSLSSKEVSFTITLDEENPISDVPYHHRPLSVYINSIIEAGFGIKKFEEIFPPLNIQEMYGEIWKSPRYCIFTCIKNK